MKLEELIAKMEQIEQQVALTLQEYPRGHTVERQRLVLAIVKQIRSHLADQLRTGRRVAVLEPETETGHLRLEDAERGSAPEH